MVDCFFSLLTQGRNNRGQKKLKTFNIHFIGLVFLSTVVISAILAFTDKTNNNNWEHKKYSFLIISVAQSSSYNRYNSNPPYLINTNVNTNNYINI